MIKKNSPRKLTLIPVVPAAPSLAVEWWPIDRPVPYEGNARKLSRVAVVRVAASLKEFGWRQPIVVDDDGVIIVGHTRVLAARSLDMVKVPVHVAAGLTPAQVKAYRLADNRVADETYWDDDKLAAEVAALNDLEFDLALTGFSSGEVDSFLRASAVAAAGIDQDEVPAPDAGEKQVSVLGDLWVLGEHRLLCGDSTDAVEAARLLGGELAHLVWTDPPYNVNYEAENRPRPMSAARQAKPLGKVANDNKSPEDFRAFLDSVYASIDSVLAPGRAIYICHADTEGHHFRNAFLAQPWKLQSCIIWLKTSMVFGRSDYHWQHEPILYGWKDGTKRAHYEWMHEPILYGWKEGEAHTWEGDRKQTTVMEVATDHLNKAASDTAGVYVHPTQKPVGLIERGIVNSCRSGEIVFDPFGGSGSTLIACEKTKRRARLIELVPHFVDVAVVRWEAYSGQVARLEDGRTFAQVKAERAAPVGKAKGTKRKV